VRCLTRQGLCVAEGSSCVPLLGTELVHPPDARQLSRSDGRCSGQTLSATENQREPRCVAESGAKATTAYRS
jgi:hypothetical protein